MECGVSDKAMPPQNSGSDAKSPKRSVDAMLAAPQRMITFAAGPTKLPRQVKEELVRDILDLDDTGIGILEYSHRSKKFTSIMNSARDKLRQMLRIPENFHILFLQGGATGQFAGVPLNLMGQKRKADYLVTGTWSAKAVKEAQAFGEIREICDRVPGFKELPHPNTYKFDPEAAYFYYCDNETVHGVEFNDENTPRPPEGVPMVCDMSSNLMSRPIDFSRFGIIFAGAQKNMGCPGVTITLVRDDLLNQAMALCPGILNYKLQVQNGSLYNTAPTFNIYLTVKICEWAETLGSMERIDELCKQRSQKVYEAIDNSDGFYTPHVTNKKHRSRLNVILKCPKPEFDAEWQVEAGKCGLLNLNGHRSIGGLRISMYNAMTIEEVEKLILFMEEFRNLKQNI